MTAAHVRTVLSPLPTAIVRAMGSPETRPSIQAPAELLTLLDSVTATLNPVEIWLFGSRARGDERPDSDWDLLAALPDDTAADLMDPLVAWNIARTTDIQATLLSTTMSELRALWGLPNTLGYDLARDGIKLVVG